MYVRSKTHSVNENMYTRPHQHFGRCRIVIHLGDFLQLSPTAQISLVADPNKKDKEGKYTLAEPPTLEIQHAIRLFNKMPDVFELRGTKRFVVGDPIIEFLDCMRTGRAFPDHVWTAFQNTFANDQHGQLDERHALEKFRTGYGMAMYWEPLSRWIPRRARRDACQVGVPLVFLLAADECNTLDKDAYSRRSYPHISWLYLCLDWLYVCRNTTWSKPRLSSVVITPCRSHQIV